MVALVVAKRFNSKDGDGTLGSGKAHSPKLNRSNDPSSDPNYQVGAGQKKQYAVFEYDYDRDGPLAVGHNAFGWYLPTNSVVVDVFVDILDQIDGPTAVKLGLLASADLVTTGLEAAASLVAGNVEPSTESGWLKTSTTNFEVMLEATIAGSTAGKVVCFVGYVVSTSA